MKFSIEPYGELIDDINYLYDIAVDEVVIDCPFKYEVDHDQFMGMDSIGILRAVAARDDDKLAGVHISMITNDIFYKDKKTAFVLDYFLLKEYRGGGRGLKMFQFVEDDNVKRNIDRSFMSRKIHINNEKLFNALGYNHIEANYEKYYV